MRILLADQASQIASDRLRGRDFAHCGGGVVEEVAFVEDVEGAVLPSGEQLDTTYIIRPRGEGGLSHCRVSFGERIDDLRGWCAEDIGIPADEIRFWFER